MDGRTRRQFLKEALAAACVAAAGPYVVPASARGADGTVSPSERITMGIMGAGPRGCTVLGHFLQQPDVQWLAVCDCRQDRLKAVKDQVDRHYGRADCQAYPDFREMFARQDIDAVLIATGDRWHALASIYAARAGKDVYSEKPISLTVEEGRALVETCRRYGTVYQAGHQRRSVDIYRFQVEAVHKGLIGQLKTIIAQSWEAPVLGPEAPRPVPPGFDYDMWLGQTPWHPFTNARVNHWTLFWDTSGGPISDMGCHYTDIAQWGHRSDDTGPVHFEGEAVWPPPEAFSEIPVSSEVRCTYADGVTLVCRSRARFEDRFIRFEGTDGWIQVNEHTNDLLAEPASILKMRSVAARSWATMGDHVRNFLDCIRSRRPTVCPPETAHRAMSIPQLVNICLRLGRPLKWDPKAERFIGDPEADKMLARAMRPPWTR